MYGMVTQSHVAVCYNCRLQTISPCKSAVETFTELELATLCSKTDCEAIKQCWATVINTNYGLVSLTCPTDQSCHA